MYTFTHTKSFKKSFKKIKNSGDFSKKDFINILDFLSNGEVLPKRYKDHKLLGDFMGYRELHIKPDLLLIYKVEKAIKEIILVDIGSHSDLF